MSDGLIIAVVPARAGSKGIKNKNLREIAGKPLLGHAIECGLASPSIDHVIVSTEDAGFADVARAWGADVPFMRPAELAEDTSPMLPVLQHAIEQSERHYGRPVSVVVLLHCTSPLRTVEDVEACVAMIQADDCDAVVSARPARRNPYFNMVMADGDYIRLAMDGGAEITRRQDAPDVYDLDTSVWVYTRAALMDQEARLPERTKVYVIPEERSSDVDTELDFKLLECMMAIGNQRDETR